MINATEQVRSTCATVAAESAEVRINSGAVKTFAEHLIKENKHVVKWDDGDWHFVEAGGSRLTAQYIFVLDAMNFCFWPVEGLEYEHLAKGLKAALLADPTVFNGDKLEALADSDVSRWLHPFKVPLLAERTRLLRELGAVLMTKYAGWAVNMLEACENSAIQLVNLITSELPGFRDSSIYKGRQVFFYKRAQILVADLWAAYGRSGAMFPDIAALTMFADYRVPQVLRHYGVLEYSESLAHRVDSKEEIPFGAPVESEIRACTVVAVDLLRAELARAGGKALIAVEVDWLLWQLGEAALASLAPPHRILTIFY